jgi:formylglycine-generating enzyme required for sulfatase activity
MFLLYRRPAFERRNIMTGNRIRALFCLAATLIAIGSKADANIIYTLNPVLGNDGTTLTGVITTDGATGPLSAADILAATFEAPGDIAGSTAFSGAAQLSQISATDSGLLFESSSSSLLFNAPTAGDPDGQVDLLTPTNQSSWTGFLNIEETFPPATGEAQLTFQGYFATATVPEPATIVLLGTVILGLVGMRFARWSCAMKVFTFCLLIPFATVAATARADVLNMSSGQTSLSFVTVGDPGNAPDTTVMNDRTTGYGAVPYTFYMGTYDVTIGQYVQFLNAVAKTDPYSVYNASMGMDYNYSTQGISETGSPGSYSYSVTGSNPQAANCPVFDVSWLDAARFCNWLQNGQPIGSEGTSTTEAGAYTLNGDVSFGTESRNAGATYFIPSENEWYKAAYYVGGGTNAGYWTYPTQSNTAPGNSLALAMSQSNEASYEINGYTDGLTAVGTFSASPGPYGTFDMGGDVFQWNEANFGDLGRGTRGGAWDYGFSTVLTSYLRDFDYPTDYEYDIGFRVASSEAVPEPGSLALLLGGAVAVLIWRRRRVPLAAARHRAHDQSRTPHGASSQSGRLLHRDQPLPPSLPGAACAQARRMELEQPQPSRPSEITLDSLAQSVHKRLHCLVARP